MQWLNVDYREGKYVIPTKQQNLSAVDAVRLYQGSEVNRIINLRSSCLRTGLESSVAG